ncbi:MAG: hypothetical protein GXX79_13840 [Actinomycetales bacterium]|nr:hypothetical protein [Actinomycetales bacterium]
MNHIFVDRRGGRHDAVTVRVVVTVDDGVLNPMTTLVGRLTAEQATALIDAVRRHLAVERSDR